MSTKLFWLMFMMFILVVTGGMMAGRPQLGVIAKDLGVEDFKVNLHFFVAAALPLALMLRPHHERHLPLRCSAGSRTISAGRRRW